MMHAAHAHQLAGSEDAPAGGPPPEWRARGFDADFDVLAYIEQTFMKQLQSGEFGDFTSGAYLPTFEEQLVAAQASYLDGTGGAAMGGGYGGVPSFGEQMMWQQQQQQLQLQQQMLMQQQAAQQQFAMQLQQSFGMPQQPFLVAQPPQ
eukprot:4705482-Prymnesium_polylepis.1